MNEPIGDSGLRDELWDSLWRLRFEIDRLAAEDLDGSERERKIIGLLARIVVAEMDHRGRKTSPLQNGHDNKSAE